MANPAPAARTPGAKRAGPGEYVFNLAKVNHILGGPDYSTANGACVEGDRMIVGRSQDQRPVHFVFRLRRKDRCDAHMGHAGIEHVGFMRR